MDGLWGPPTWRGHPHGGPRISHKPIHKAALIKNCILENRVPFPHLALAHLGGEDGEGVWRVGVGGVYYSISGELPDSPPPPGTCCVCAHSLGFV